jgi:hypothetical protein
MSKVSKKIVSEPSLPAVPEKNYFTEYARIAAGGGNIVGMLLKFSKGDWVAGQDNEEMEKGTRLIANMEALLVGWQRWEDARPAEQIMGPLVEGFRPPPRSELSFNDPKEWEQDESTGKPRDPWVYTHLMLMKAPGKKGQLYTFTTNSAGGKTAIGKLAGAYGLEMRERPDEFPIVELQAGSYPHRDPSIGRVKVPEFELVGWAKKSEFDEAQETSTPSTRKKIK